MSDADRATLRSRLSKTRERYESLEAELEAYDQAQLERLGEAIRRLDGILDTYEDRATGSGDFGAYVAFRQTIETFVDELPPEIPHHEAFETVGEIVDKRRLSPADFERVRDTIEAPRTLAARLDEFERAREEYMASRRAVREHISSLDDRVAELDRILAYGEVDLEAPVDEIQGPIRTYNASVEESFQEFHRQSPASDVLRLFSLGRRYPQVPIPEPPDTITGGLGEVAETRTIPELLEFASFSRSKLAHYVDDPGAVTDAIANDRAYLERLDATPFTIPWPPPRAAELQWRIRELMPLVNRFAGDAVMINLRQVRALTRAESRFDRLRETAVAKAALTPSRRERLRSGEIAEERDAIQREQARLEERLSETPEP